MTSTWTITAPEIMEMPRDLDSDTAADVQQDAMLCIKSGAKELILDCRETESLTGAGLRTMLTLASEMQKTKGKFAVCNLHGQPKEMFEACNFGFMINSYSTQEEAVARIAA